MKKRWIMVVLIVSFLLSGCASIQARMADSAEELHGIEGKTYEEHKEYYQAEWDDLFEEFKLAWDYLTDKEKKDKTDTKKPDVESEISATEGLPQETKPHSDTKDDAYWESNLNKTIANINSSQYNNRFNKGQCTWYAQGRFAEKTKIDNLNVSGNAKEWLDHCADDRVYVESDITKIVAPAIAVDCKSTDPDHPGHVTVVEYITYDEQGKPVDVYFTESNWDSNGAYNENVDGIVKKLAYENFIKRGSHTVLGYIIPKN